MNRSFNPSPGKHPGAALWGLFLLLTVGFALPVKAQFTAQSDPLGTMIVTGSESCSNGALDPGETVTLNFRIKNTSGADKANVKATLLSQGNVTFPVTTGQTFPYGSGQVTIGSMAKDEIKTVAFQFRVEGTCGGTITPAISVVADNTAAQTITFSSITPTTPANGSLNNELGLRVPTIRDTASPGSGVTIPTSGSITIQDFGPAGSNNTGSGRANPYPSTITVSGVPHVTDSATFLTGERVSKVEVLVNGLKHDFSQDVQLLLVGPQGQTVMLMNDAGSQTAPFDLGSSGVNLLFAQSGSALPQTTAISSGTYRPSNYGPNDTMPAPAPGGSYGSSLDVFGTTDRTATPPNPNGDWKLYVVDDTAGGAGSITSWSLRITTMKVDCCGAAQTFPSVRVDSVNSINEDSTANNTTQNIATFTVNDIEGGLLTLSATSANTALVADSNLEFVSGNPTLTAATSVQRTLRVKGNGLVPNAYGSSLITITAQDAQGHATSTQFTLTVNPVNDLPTVSAIANQSANVGQPTSVLNFTIGDVETAAANLTLIGTSSDQSVVPNGNIFFTGSGASRSVQVFPASSTTSGTATVTITVRDRGATDIGSGPGETPTSFVVAFNVQPGYPTITPISGQSVDEDPSTAKTVSFTVAPGSGSSTAVTSLTVAASSSNTSVVPSSGIVVTQPNSSGTASVALTPTANANGTTTITLTVTDPQGAGTTDDRVTTTTFVLTVNSVNDLPTITAISDQSINEDTSTGALAFTINDVENGTTLTLSASSSDESIIPSTVVTDTNVPGVVFGGSAGNRTISVRPAADAFGAAAITVTVTDANGGTASRTFRVTIAAVNDAPRVTQAGLSGGTLVNLASNATDAPVAVTVNEDTGNFTVALAGVAPGPANESADQTVNLTVTSSDTTKVQVRTSDTTTASTRTFTNVGSTPTFVLVTQANATGDAVITLDLSDSVASPNTGTTTRKFTVRLSALNDPPTLGDIANRPSEQSGAGLSVPLTIADVETATASLTVTATSSNQAVVRDSNIFAVANNTQLSILTEATPGATTITVTVSDPNGGSVSKSFTLTTSNIAPPSISVSPTSATIDEDTITSATVTGSGQGALTFTKSSGNTILVPNENVIISGTGNTRTLVIVPAADQPTGAPGTTGTAAISVTVTDERGASATTTFNLTVRAIPDNPILTLLGNLSSGSITLNEDATATDDSTRTSGKLELRAFDAEDGTSLTLNISSSNTGLIPNGVVASGSEGVAILGAAGDGTRKVEIKPKANQNGSATLTLSGTDSSGRVATATLVVNVTAVNDEPLLTQPTTPLNVNEDFSTQTITLAGIAAGPSNAGESGQSLTVSVSTANVTPNTTSPSTILNASVTPNVASDGTATLTLTPIANQSGTVDVTVTVTDNGGTANGGDNAVSRTIRVNVASVNDQPSLSFANTSVTIIQPGTAPGFTVVPFTVGDIETSAFSLTVFGTSDATGVVVSPTAADFGGSGTDRSVRLTAASGTVTGTANVTITVDDGSGTSNATRSQVLAVTVRVPSQNPDITLSPTQITMPPNTESQVITLSVSDFQQSASQLSVTYTSDNTALIPSGPQTVSSGANGATSQVQFQGTGSATRQVIIRPVANQFGVANLTFTVHDNDTTDHTGTATLRVVVSTNPTVTPDVTSSNLPQNSAATTVGVTVADNETASGFLSLAATSSNTTLIPNANISVSSGSASNRRNVTFTPVANQTGAATIQLVVTDSDGLTGTNSIVVNVANTPPTITGPSSASTPANGSVTLTFTVADTETPSGSLGTLTVTPTSNNSTLVPATNVVVTASGATRTVVITPVANQAGSALITLTVTDGQGGTGTANVLITVTNAAPTVTPPAAQTIGESSSTGILSFTVADSDGSVGSLTVAGTSSNQALVPNSGISIPAGTGATRTVTVTPVSGQSGTATITLTATDALGATGTATFLLTVVTNNPPTISTLNNVTTQVNQPATVTFTVGDTETPGASISTTYTSSNSALVNASTGIQQASATSGSRTIVITPTQGQSGTTTITVTATDAGGKTAQASFTLTVSANTNPTITPVPLTAQTINVNSSTAALPITIGDSETAVANLQLSATSSNPTLVPTTGVSGVNFGGSGANRTVTITPAANQSGTAVITITVTDAAGGSASTSVSVTVLQRAAAKGDFDGDGKADILFKDNDGFLAAWLMDGRNLKSASFLIPSSVGDVNYRIAATGDFNRDGQEDILFQHSDGTLAVWYMSGTSQSSAALISPSNPGDSNWKVAAVADMDADQNADIIFQHTDGTLAVWYLNGVTQRSAALLSPSNPGDRNWRVVGVGDFNGDSKQDLAFQHTDGTLAAWYLNGIALTTPTLLSPSHPGDAAWRVIGVADRNADGKPDLLFQHTDYSVASWYLNGVTLSSAQLLNPSNSGATWRAAAPK